MEIGNQLRKKLVGTKTVTVTERLLPSDLLKEFDLARGGLTKYIARNISAPPSDILLYGEFKPKTEQKLKSTKAELSFKLILVSPTGMCKDRNMEFTCFSNELEAITKKALELISTATNEVNAKLASGQKRGFSEKEFQEFKKQAFRLMPNPPLKEGVFYRKGSYRGPSQDGTPLEFERAFHMLECAMLFKGDDTQILVCAGAILNGMSHRYIKKYSQSAKADFFNASLEIIERAYLLDSNWNTRGMYHRFGMGNNSLSQKKLYAISAARQIWNTREIDPWHKHQTREAFITLFQFETNYEKKCQLFIATIDEYAKDVEDVRYLFTLLNIFVDTKGMDLTIDQKINFAERLLDEGSDCAKTIAHLLYLTIYSDVENSDNKIEYFNELEKHLLASLAIIPKLNAKYGKKFATTSSYLSRHLREYQRIHKKYNIKHDIFEVMEKYINSQMETGIYTGGDSHVIIYELLPEMWKKGRYKQAYELITQFLENYTWSGSADFERMKLARQRRRFMSKIDGASPLSMNQLEKIRLAGKDSDQITKVILSNGNIFGICCSSSQYRNGKVFRLIPGQKQADILEEVSGNVRDIACTDNFLGAVTQKKGLYLINQNDLKISQFTPKNSSLPNIWLTLICGSGKEFFIAAPDKENYYTHVYRLDPEKMKISQTNTKFVTHLYWRLKTNTLKTEKFVVIPQTWDRRTFVTGDETIELSCGRELRAIKDVTVRSDKEGLLMEYKGFELSYVYDFIRWKGVLVFATGNGLYASKPGSNELQCLISEPEMLFFSLCPFEDGMYIGTSKGLYWIDHDTFRGSLK
jgi:hypothetical protein